MTYPSRWELVSLGEALGLINGRAFKPAEWVTKGTPIIRIQNLNDPDAHFNYYAGDLPEKFRVQRGDLLFAWSGTPGTSFGAHIWRGDTAWLNQHIFRIAFPPSLFEKRFLQLAINQNLREYVHAAHGGAGLAHITKGKFEASTLPVPPLAEQRRIVAKIEELFSELDKGIENLKQARAQLTVYRQALLKHAFEGKLTRDWRKANADKLESADHLLARIRGEREACYEQQLQRWNTAAEDWKSNGEKGVKPKKPRAPKEHVPISKEEAETLCKLPPGWRWVRLGELVQAAVGYAFESKEFSDRGIRLLRGDNIEPGSLRWENTRYWPSEKAEPYRDLMVAEGEIIIAMDRPVISTGLKVAVARPSDLPCLLVQRVTKLARQPGVDNGYLFHVINQQRFRNHCLGTQTGTQLPHISESQICDYLVPLCSSREQEQICELLESATTTVDEQVRTIDDALQKAEVLRQSILKKAFAGELVPQDSADEPASALLARIRLSRQSKAAADVQRETKSNGRATPPKRISKFGKESHNHPTPSATNQPTIQRT